MNNLFAYLLLTTVLALMLILYLLSLIGILSIEQEIITRILSIMFFLAGATWLISGELKKNKSTLSQHKNEKILVLLPLVILLVSSVLNKVAGTVVTALFVSCALLFSLKRKEFFLPNKFYYILFGYVLFLFLGTIGTFKGFHFPGKISTFLFLPITFSFFNLSNSILLRIARLFFRVMLLYLAVCIVYWWFNFLCLDAGFIEWTTSKLSFQVNMFDWVEQSKLSYENNFAAFFFVNSWSYYYHPSYISIVLLFALITGFYLYYKQDDSSKITIFELAIFVVACFLVLALMESRIGVLIFCILCAVSVLYYVKLKTKHFRLFLLLYTVSGLLLIVVGKDLITGFYADEARNSLLTIATAYIKDHFWWGTGSFEQATAINSMKEMLFPGLKDYNYVHNQFFGNMIQFGIWGLVILVVLLAGILGLAIRKRSYLLQMFLLIMFLFMLIEEPLYIQAGITRFTVFLTFFVAICDSNSIRKKLNFSSVFKKTGF
ncbi:MAG: O-antigen ligase family protein [Paludibacter sp.]|nr:O-antigen ligase family protein [Paludibacter sp.]